MEIRTEFTQTSKNIILIEQDLACAKFLFSEAKTRAKSESVKKLSFCTALYVMFLVSLMFSLVRSLGVVQ